MPDPIYAYWQVKLDRCKRAKEKERFELFVATDPASTGALFFDRIFPDLKVQTASWGDSLTMLATGIADTLRADSGVRWIDPFDVQASAQERLERRRQALLADLFLTGTNAVTEGGQLVNLDMGGNRDVGL
jgi:hypothetical protein